MNSISKHLSFNLLTILMFVNCGVPLLSAQEREKIVLSTILTKDEMSERVESRITRTYKKLGYDMEIRNYPASRSLIIANSGEVDGEVMRIRELESELDNMIRIKTPIVEMHLMAFSKDPTIIINGWKSLKPYRIAHEIGIRMIEENSDGLKVEPVTSPLQAYNLLLIDRVDILLDTKIGGLSMLERNNWDDIHMLEPPITTRKMYHYIHKKRAYLAEDLERVLKETPL